MYTAARSAAVYMLADMHEVSNHVDTVNVALTAAVQTGVLVSKIPTRLSVQCCTWMLVL